ncbi:3179_t:CDS:2, partial [Scutellospora calospora]
MPINLLSKEIIQEVTRDLSINNLFSYLLLLKSNGIPAPLRYPPAFDYPAKLELVVATEETNSILAHSNAFLQKIINASCTSIKQIYVYIGDKDQICGKLLAQIIMTQRALEYAEIHTYNQILNPIIQALKSLESLEFQSCMLNIENFQENCFSMQKLQQFTYINYELIDGRVFNFLVKLLKSTTSLKYLNLFYWQQSIPLDDDLVSEIINFCSQLKYLGLPVLGITDIMKITKSCHRLKYLYIRTKILLDNFTFLQLARSLPSDLQDLIIDNSNYQFDVLELDQIAFDIR